MKTFIIEVTDRWGRLERYPLKSEQRATEAFDTLIGHPAEHVARVTLFINGSATRRWHTEQS